MGVVFSVLSVSSACSYNALAVPALLGGPGGCRRFPVRRMPPPAVVHSTGAAVGGGGVGGGGGLRVVGGRTRWAFYGQGGKPFMVSAYM